MREPFTNTRVYLTALLILEIVLGILIIILTACYEYVMGTYLADMERNMLGGQLFNSYLLGLQIIITYACGFTMWKQLWVRRATANVILMIGIWTLFCFLAILCGFGTIWSLYTCAEAVENIAESSLLKGIDLYYTCPQWKLLWDGLQFHKECCGVHGYEDWMRAAWMPPESSNEQCPDETAEGQKKVKALTVDTDDEKPALAPYACCKHSCSSCFENYIPRSGNSGIPYLNLTQINTGGCLALFSRNLWHLIHLLLLFVLLVFLIALLICCLTKYIIRHQNSDEGGPQVNMGLTDDQGRPLVILKCPPSVRCVTLDDSLEEDPSNENFKGGKSKPYFQSSTACVSEECLALKLQLQQQLQQQQQTEYQTALLPQSHLPTMQQHHSKHMPDPIHITGESCGLNDVNSITGLRHERLCSGSSSKNPSQCQCCRANMTRIIH